MKRLLGKKILVTGAGSGIGRATALAFTKEGAEVVAADVNYGSILELATSSETPGAVKPLKLDLLKKEDVDNAVRDVGRIDGLINCAGWVPHGNIVETTDEVWDKVMNLNTKGAFWMTRGFIPLSLHETKPLVIVNVASIASSIKGVPDRCAYSASKAALIGLTKSIAADFVGQKIRANCICPGSVDTPGFRARMLQDKDKLNELISKHKMGRIGLPEEIAALALYLTSEGRRVGFCDWTKFRN